MVCTVWERAGDESRELSSRQECSVQKKLKRKKEWVREEGGCTQRQREEKGGKEDNSFVCCLFYNVKAEPRSSGI